MMEKRFPMYKWNELAENYALPVSLIGYIAKRLLTPGNKTLDVVIKFLETHYAARNLLPRN